MGETIDRVLVAAGILVVGGVAWWGGLRPLDRFLFDALARQGVPRGGGEAEVVVVGLAPEAPAEAFSVAAAEVRRAGAAGLVVLVDGEEVEVVRRGGGVPPGTIVGQRAGDGDGGGLPLAVIPPSRDGLQRVFVPRWRGRATLAARVAESLGRRVPGSERLCLFRAGRSTLAVLSGGHVTGELGAPRSLVDGRIVLIGRLDPAEARVTTFRHRGEDALPPLLFHAAVLECLLDGDLVRELPAGWAWVLALVFACVVTGAGMAWHRASAGLLGGGALVLVLAGAWLVLHAWQVWVCPGAALWGVVLATGWVAWRRESRRRAGIGSVLRRLSSETEARAGGKGFLVEESPWPRVRAALAAAFGHSPALLLRVSSEGNRLEPACDDDREAVDGFFGGRMPGLDDEPIAGARDAEGVIAAGGDRHVVVLPGEHGPHGFYVFAAPSGHLPGARIMEFAAHLGGLLDDRERWRARARPYQLATRAGGGPTFRSLHDRLAGSIDLLDGHRQLLEDSLAAARGVTLVIDVFGELLHGSASAAGLGADLGLDLGRCCPVELLAAVTGRGLGECRGMWRSAILGREGIAVAARPELRPGRRFLVRLVPLRHRAVDRTAAVVVHLEDVTGLARGSVLKDEFIERIYYQLNNDFESIVGAASIIDDRRLGGGDRAVLVGTIRHKAEEATAMLRRTRRHFRREFSLEPPDAYPIRIDPVLEAAAALVAGRAAARGIVLEREEHPYAQLVLASPRRLEGLAAAILRVLVRDARDGSRIAIAAHQNRGGLSVVFENDGFGMPADRLRSCLAHPPAEDREMAGLGRARRHLAAWGGSLTADAVVDRGLRFQVRLRCVV